jgi:sec-independent protein translocase protein TatC
MSLLDHLDELRRRLVRAIGALAVAFIPCWYFREPIVAFLSAPIKHFRPDLKLAFLGVTDPFLFYFKVSALASVFLAAPFILYQLWSFVAPGLYRKEKLYAAPFVIMATLFFVSGGAFAYYVAFPSAIHFLLDIGNQFQAVITIDRYFSFLLTVILGLGLMFELPILILLFALMGLVTPGFLMRHFRWAVLIIFIVAAVITPTSDVVNLCIFAVPTLGLYLLGVGAAWVATRGRRRAAAAAELENAEGD